MAMAPISSQGTQQQARHSPREAPISDSVSSLRTVHIDSSVVTEQPTNTTTQSSKIIAGYALQGRLGIGSFASVYRGVRVVTDTSPATGPNETIPKVVAIKAISRSEKLSKKILDNLEIEISLLTQLRHANIVELFQVEKTPSHYYLVLEYCGGGDLQRLIRSRKNGRLSERLTRRLFRDLTAGMKCLYERQLIHRDIKPQNLLLTGPLPMDEMEDECKDATEEMERQKENYPSSLFALKLADFGFARHLQTASLAETLCGSPLYMAPEILQHQRYDATADLWSAGAVLFEMVAGRPPFHGENHIDLLRNIQRRAVRLPPGVKISPECINLLRILLNRNPSRRATFEQFFQATDEFISLGCNGPVTGAAPHTSGAISGAGDHLLSVHTTLMALDKISEESPLSESSSGNEVEEHSSPQHLQLAQDPLLSMVPTRNAAQASTERVSFLPSNLMNMVTPNPSSLFHHGSGAVSGGTALAKHQNQVLSCLTPLVPSPPGPMARNPSNVEVPIPPPFSLDGYGGPGGIVPVPSPRQQSQINSMLPSLTTTTNAHEPLQQNRQVSRRASAASVPESLSQSSDGDEFVMVEHQMQISSVITYESATQPPELRRSYSGLSGRRPSAGKGPPTHPTPYRRFCGLLSTSPGTGGKLVGAMMQQVVDLPQAPVDRGQIESDGLEMTVKMLAAAEDVGRRAVNVAHLGDTRAYLAMRVLMGASICSSLSSIPMEGVEESDADGLTGGKSRRSYLSKAASKMSIKEEVGDDDDDEMPFAVATVASDDSAASGPDDSSTTGHCDDLRAMKSNVSHPSASVIAQVHFREALACYLKALPLMRGAVNAAQRVVEAVRCGHSVDGSHLRESNERNVLSNRCQLSLQWLAGQFNGVLERAEAATSEVQKLSVQSSKENSQEIPMVKVEELIYNHSLACGRDGAVKQLLGQYEAARICYRSAGLLAETLLMEPRLNTTDKQILEGYVNGFADRIREVERIVEYGVDVKASEVVGIVGGVQQHGPLKSSSSRSLT